MAAKNTVESDALVHRALADRSRVRILETLRDADASLDARELALAVGLHVNTVRSHLRQLERAELVHARRDAQGKPGRPHIVFESASPAEPGSDDVNAYRVLVEVLAHSVAGEPATAKNEAEAAACSAARALTSVDKETRPNSAPHGTVGLNRVMHLLSSLGFDPVAHAQTDTDEIVMHSCPFEDLGHESLEIACSVHRGLIRGALGDEASADDPTVVELHPEPGHCIARIAATG